MASSHISNNILFMLLMRLHQTRPSPRSRYSRCTSRRWEFCQHPFHPHLFFFFHFPHTWLRTHPPQKQVHAGTNHPPLPPLTLTLRLWHRCLDNHFGLKRGLTKVSMATVQSVNHAAADVSSPSLFPFPPSSCLYKAPPLLSYSCIPFLHPPFLPLLLF